jgi:hypothetical protein
MERHTDLPERKTVTLEELTVFLADKTVLGASTCTLEERYENRLKEYEADDEAAEAIRRRWKRAEKWHEHYERLLSSGRDGQRGSI